MRSLVCWWFVFMPTLGFCQLKWDGGAGTANWKDPANWHPDRLPSKTDSVLLDNSLFANDYEIRLPEGNIPLELVKMMIIPANGKRITVEIPYSSTAVPALLLSDPKDGLIIETGGIFINSSGAASGNPLQLAGKLRLQQFGRYIHKTVRGNADLTSRISTAPGTENGVFEFDIPGNSASTVSLTGKTFGSLVFTAPAGGTKLYQSAGSSTCKIRGNLEIKTGAKLSSFLNSDIYLFGNLDVNGTLTLNPSTPDTTARSFHFSGKTSVWKGSGIVEIHPGFRQIIIDSNAHVDLIFPIILPNDSNAFVVKGRLNAANQFPITGNGSFMVADGGGMYIHSPEGICSTCSTSAVQVKRQRYSDHGNYYFRSTSKQKTGIHFPDSVQNLFVQNPFGLINDKPLFLRDSLILQTGVFVTNDENAITVDAKKIKSYHHNSYVVGKVDVRLTDSETHLIPLGNQERYAPIFIRNAPGSTQTGISLRYATSASNLSFNFWDVQLFDQNKSIYLGPIPQRIDSLNEGVEIETWILEGGNWKVTDTKQVTVKDQIGLEMKNPVSGSVKMTISQQKNQFLPIESVHLSGYSENNRATLILSIIGSGEKLYIQHSLNGADFTTIDTLPEKVGKDPVIWKDRDFLMQTRFFRVQFFKGTTPQYSNILKISPRNVDQVKIYPNPAQEKLSIFSANPCSILTFIIVNNAGVVVRKLRSSDRSLDIKNLASGSYLLQIAGCDHIITLPFTKN